MLAGASVDLETAFRLESEGFVKLFGSPVNKALLNIFFLTDLNKKDRGVKNQELKPAKLNQVSVIGAGIMGQGIAAANLKRGFGVAITDNNPAALSGAVSQVLEEASYNRQMKQTDLEKMKQLSGQLNSTESDRELASADLVIEAIIEKEAIKKELFARLEDQLPEQAILASNTSTIPITKLAEDLKRPENFCGFHFFNPVRKMKLVEIIRGEKTSDQTIVTAVAHAKALGKMPVVVSDGPGFFG